MKVLSVVGVGVAAVFSAVASAECRRGVVVVFSTATSVTVVVVGVAVVFSTTASA